MDAYSLMLRADRMRAHGRRGEGCSEDSGASGLSRYCAALYAQHMPPPAMTDVRIIAAREGDEIDVTEAVRVAYDVAIQSMDFGSGFLSTEEVAGLRTLARAIGADMPPYQHDRCASCGHDRERHTDRPYPVDAEGRPLLLGHEDTVGERKFCWTDSDGAWSRNRFSPAEKRSKPDCSCEGFIGDD